MAALADNGGGPNGLHRESSGWRRYLDGRPVHAGTVLELDVGDVGGTWVRVRYEATVRYDPALQEDRLIERLYFGAGLSLLIEPGAEPPALRWPRRAL